MLVTRQLVRHVRTLRLLIQRTRSVIEHPFARKHVTGLRPLSPATGLRLTVRRPLNFPATVVSGGVASTESIKNLRSSTLKSGKIGLDEDEGGLLMVMVIVNVILVFLNLQNAAFVVKDRQDDEDEEEQCQ